MENRVAIKFDPQGIDKTTNQIKSMASQIQVADKAKKVFNTTIKAGVGVANAYASALSIAVKSMVAFKTASTAIATASALQASAMQQLQIRLQSVTGSSEKAKKALKETMDFQLNSQFSLNELVKLRAQFEAIGLEGKEAIQAVADTSTALGVSLESVGSAVKMLSSRTLKQFGIDLQKEGENFALTYNDMNGKQATVMANGFQQAQKKVLDVFLQKFEGANAQMALTLQDRIGTFGQTIKNKSSEFGMGFVDQFSVLVDEFTKVVDKLDLRQAGQDVGLYLENVTTNIMTAVEYVKQLSDLAKKIPASEGGASRLIVEAFNAGTQIFSVAVIKSLELSLKFFSDGAVILGNGILSALASADIPVISASIKKGLASQIDRSDAGNLEILRQNGLASDRSLKNMSEKQIFDYLKLSAPDAKANRFTGTVTPRDQKIQEDFINELREFAKELKARSNAGEEFTTINSVYAKEKGLTNIVAQNGSFQGFNKLSAGSQADRLNSFANETLDRDGALSNMIASTQINKTLDNMSKDWSNTGKEISDAVEHIFTKFESSVGKMAESADFNFKSFSELKEEVAPRIKESIEATKNGIDEVKYSVIGTGEDMVDAVESAMESMATASPGKGGSAYKEALGNFNFDEEMDIVAGFDQGFADFINNAGAGVYNFSNTFNDAFNEMGNMFTNFLQTGTLNFQQFASSMLAEIAKITMQMLVLQSIKTALGVPTSAISASGIGARSLGGPVSSGQPYLVGERGPELFTPSSNGTIATAQATKEAGNGASNSGGMLNIVNVVDPAIVNNYISSSEGEKTIMNIIKNNMSTINSYR